MSEQPNPFAPFFDEFRRIVREEIAAAANGNGHDSPTLLSATAAAKLWDVPKSWISEAARRGELPSVRVGHYVRFRVTDLQAFVENNAQGK
jgi:excisionase family DNA binding protein